MQGLCDPVCVDEGEDLADGLLQHVRGQSANAPRLSHALVKTLDLIREYRPLDSKPLRKQHFEGVTFHLRGDGAAEGQPHAAVV